MNEIPRDDFVENYLDDFMSPKQVWEDHCLLAKVILYIGYLINLLILPVNTIVATGMILYMAIRLRPSKELLKYLFTEYFPEYVNMVALQSLDMLTLYRFEKLSKRTKEACWKCYRNDRTIMTFADE